MAEVGGRFGSVGQAVVPRGLAAAEGAELREDEPHPMRLLAAGAQLLADAVDDRVLRRDEA